MIGAVLRFFRGFKVSHELGVFLALAVPFSPILVAISLQKPDEWSQGPNGKAQVIDGDTLVVAGERINLSGIDAPETDQVCQDALGSDYPCGEEAAQVLRSYIAGRPVACRKRNSGNRPKFTECSAGANDLAEGKRSDAVPRNGGKPAEVMIRTGHAMTAGDFGRHHYRTQQLAKVAGVGIWQGHFINPADWREGVR